MSEAARVHHPGPGFAKHPNYRVALEPSPKRVRVMFNGVAIADSRAAMLLYETRHIVVYYFPEADLAMDHLVRTDHATNCPFKGDASYYSVRVGDRTAENAVWTYQDPYDEVPELKGYMAFYWDRMDAWLEEDEEVFVHARDPKVRIDILASSRPVRVVLGGATVAETTSALFLFETGLPTRYYIPAADVATDKLEPSDKQTDCPYKGTAHYHAARIGGTLHEDIVWYYPDPVRESAPLKDLLCFFNERVDDIFVDGRPVPKVKTKWSPK